MEEKEELVSMEEVKVDIVEEEASLGSPKMERFDLEKRYHMNQVVCWGGGDVKGVRHVNKDVAYLNI